MIYLKIRHWCCTNEQPVNIVQRTRVEKEIHVVATKIRTGYTSCGFAGWSSCSVYATRYKEVAVYHIGVYEVPDENACQGLYFEFSIYFSNYLNIYQVN
jgi:hypothetical protein